MPIPKSLYPLPTPHKPTSLEEEANIVARIKDEIRSLDKDQLIKLKKYLK